MINFRPYIVRFALLVLLATAGAAVRAADDFDAARLYLQDGDFFAGGLSNCDEAGVVHWQMRGATTPFDFPTAELRAAYFPPPEVIPDATGDYLIELSNGDLLYGSLASITSDHFEFETAQFGRIRVAREEVSRLVRRNGATPSEYRGPNGLAEWQTAEADQWREEAGRLITNTARARVQKKLVIPTKARIEFDIAGGSDLEFAFILSAGTSDLELEQGYRFEVWQRSLVMLRELEDRADMTVVCELDASGNRAQFEALLDQEQGTISIHALNGKQLATIDLPPQNEEKSDAMHWVTLLNGGGELRLERLAIGHWNGRLPPQIEADKSGLCRTDGTVLYGDVIGYDANLAQFVVRTSEAEDTRVAAANVACIFTAPAAMLVDYPFRVGLHDGSRVSGELTKVAEDKIYLSRRGIEGPLACEVSRVFAIVGLQQSNSPVESRPSAGWLELDGVRSHGSLVAASATAGNSCLVWQPRLSTVSSPLDRDVSGRIVYREPARPQTKANLRALQRRERQLQIIQQQQLQRAARVRRGIRTQTVVPQNITMPTPNGAGTLYLLAGDRIPCESIEIDDAGVRFKSSVVDATFVPHSDVKALELVPKWTAAALAEEKRHRLLTLPRMQKNNPPTHLVASTGGDILRTSLVSLSADTLTVESRLETKRVPRDRVACVIWLHDESGRATADSPMLSPPTENGPDSPLVQAVRVDGVRLTFVPQKCTGTLLVGASELLGACHLELKEVDVLLLGAMIQATAEEQVFHGWKLTGAAEPRYVSDQEQGAGGAPSSSSSSGLIGKPAPDFGLTLLDGGEFKLSEQKGHVVVLDFWASWCGPCMQSLPHIDAVVADFTDRGVKLVAVNIQEDRAAAASALERLKIKPTVALDIDGAVAEHYQVTAIPHTIVIDAEGNIAKLFIGSSAESAAQLRTAIEDLLTPRTTH